MKKTEIENLIGRTFAATAKFKCVPFTFTFSNNQNIITVLKFFLKKLLYSAKSISIFFFFKIYLFIAVFGHIFLISPKFLILLLPPHCPSLHPFTTLPNVTHSEYIKLFSKKHNFLLFPNFFTALSPAFGIKETRNKKLFFQLPLKDRARPTKRKIHNTCITVKNNSSVTFKRGEVSEGKIVVLQDFSFFLSVDEVVGEVRLQNLLLKIPCCYLTTPVQLIETTQHALNLWCIFLFQA